MKTRTILLLLLVLALGAFFRLYALKSIPPGLYPDEAINGNDGIAALRMHQFRVFFPDNNGREGLFINLVGFAVAGFGHHPWAIRLVSALFGIFTILGTYLLTRRMFCQNSRPWDIHVERIALFTAFFLATSFWHVNFSRIGFRAIMAPFFLVWGLFFLFKTIEYKGELRKNILVVVNAVVGGLFFGAGIHSYIAYRVAPLLLIFPLVIGIREWRKNREKTQSCFPCMFILFLFFALVAASPLLLYFAAHPADFLGRTSQVSVFSSPEPLKTLGKNFLDTLGMFWFRGDGNWRHNLAGNPQLIFPIGALFAIGIVIAIRRMVRSGKRRMKSGFVFNIYGLLLGWLALFLLPVIISNEGIPHALRAVGIIPAVFILSALGLDWLLARSEPHIGKIAYVFLFAFLAGTAAWNYYLYFQRWGTNSEVAGAFDAPSVMTGNFLNTLPQSTEKYIVINTGGVLVNNIPMPAQTIMFITDTASAETQAKKRFVYLPPEQIERIAPAHNSAIIVLLGDDPQLRARIASAIPNAVAKKISENIIIAGPRELITSDAFPVSAE